MKNKKMLRKGFTLVELIVVIAIIAILAAVSAVSYIAFINQANESADQQAVTQMNTALQAGEASGKPKNIAEVYESLAANGMEGKDYKPLYKDRYFFWDSSINRIVYTDKDYKVSYPDKYVDQVKDNFFSLSGEIPTADYGNLTDAGSGSGKSVTITSAGALVQAVNDIKNKNITEIKVSSTNPINMQGAQLAFTGSDFKLASNSLTIEGTNTSPVVLTNIVNSESHYDSSVIKSYGGGIFGTVTSGQQLTVKNLVVENACIGSYSGSIGILIDAAQKGSKVILNNVEVKNSVIYGQNKVGIISGQYYGSDTITMTDVKLTDNIVYTNEGEAGVLFGMVFTNSGYDNSFNNAKAFSPTISNSKVQFVWNLNDKVTAGGKEYTTKYKNGNEADYITIGSDTHVIRLCVVPSENSKFVYGDTSSTHVLLRDATYNGHNCTIVYNEQVQTI